MKRFFVLAMLVACAPTDPTQLVVVVDSNLPSSAFDAVEVNVTGLEGGPQTATARLAEGALPRWVVLERRGGALGPIEIEARAMSGATPGVARRVRTSFVRGQTRRVDLFLQAGCDTSVCEAGCERGGACGELDVPPETLQPWTEPTAADGSMPNPDAEVDGGLDGGSECNCPGGPLPTNATGTTCDGTRCVLICAPLTGACGGVFEDGCNQALTVPEHCGACSKACGPATANEVSQVCGDDGVCRVECVAGGEFQDCNDDGWDGCETNVMTSLAHCGRCGMPCAGTRCMMGRCIGG